MADGVDALHAPDRPQSYAHPARLILILSLAPTIGLGIGRFAYALVLPDMRDTLGWSYSAAGFMNTVNAAGYLAGALLAAPLIRRCGLVESVRWGTLACVLSLALCAMSGNFWILSFARLLALRCCSYVLASIRTASALPFTVRITGRPVWRTWSC